MAKLPSKIRPTNPVQRHQIPSKLKIAAFCDYHMSL